MTVASATACPVGIRSLKNIKNWRENVKYLPSVDTARFLRKSSSVLMLNIVTLRKEMEERNAGQRRRSKIAVRCCSCGAAYHSRRQRGGNCESRRQCQRQKRELLRDQRTVSQILARFLSPNQGGTDPRNLETTGRLQILQHVRTPSEESGRSNPARKGDPLYAGIIS